MANLNKVERIVKGKLVSEIESLNEFRTREARVLLKAEIEKQGLEISERNLYSYMNLERYNREVYVLLVKVLKKLKRESEKPKPKVSFDVESRRAKEEADKILKDLGI